MATKVKPCRVNATWTPQAWDVPVYVNADTFQRGQASCNVKAFIISWTEAQKKQKLWDAINYYVVSWKIPLLSMDSVTYTLIKAVRWDGEGGIDDVYTFSSAVNSDTGKYKEVKVNVNSTTPISTTVDSYTVTEHSAWWWGWWDVLVSSQANNILQSWMKIRAGTETDYSNLWTYDSQTLYLTVPDSTPQ